MNTAEQKLGPLVKEPTLEELPKLQPGALTFVDPFMALIERVAMNPDVDVAKLEKILDMQERVLTKQAEVAFNEAMSACQSELRTVVADAENPQTKSKYASYAQLDRAMRPIYTRHGFSISYNTGESKHPEAVMVIAIISKGAYSRRFQIEMPADGKGAKGGDVMTKTHATGAAVSYGMRYLLKAIFNVSVGEEDVDGNATAPKIQPDEEGKKALEACGSMTSLAECWNKLPKDKRKTLVEVRDACKEKIKAADKEAS